MNKLSKLIEETDYDELIGLQKALKDGTIERLINNRIKHFYEGVVTVCPVCQTELLNPDDETLSLQFGSRDFRRKATFCATDCLEYFLSKIKSTSLKKIND